MTKGNKHERLQIVAYNPWQRFWRRLLVLLLIVLLAGAGYGYGRWEDWNRLRTAESSVDGLREQAQGQAGEITELRRQLAVARSSSDVDRQAYREMQQTVENLNARIAQLENEVAFYTRVMAPGDVDQGLRVDTWQLQPGNQERVYDYKLVITQVTNNNTYIQGRALVNLIGRKGQTQVAIPLKDVSPQVDDLSIRFRFRFFQNVVGQVRLPENFKPEKVEVILQSIGDKAMRVEKEFDWPGEGA